MLRNKLILLILCLIPLKSMGIENELNALFSDLISKDRVKNQKKIAILPFAVKSDEKDKSSGNSLTTGSMSSPVAIAKTFSNLN